MIFETKYFLGNHPKCRCTKNYFFEKKSMEIILHAFFTALGSPYTLWVPNTIFAVLNLVDFKTRLSDIPHQCYGPTLILQRNPAQPRLRNRRRHPATHRPLCPVRILRTIREVVILILEKVTNQNVRLTNRKIPDFGGFSTTDPFKRNQSNPSITSKILLKKTGLCEFFHLPGLGLRK